MRQIFIFIILSLYFLLTKSYKIPWIRSYRPRILSTVKKSSSIHASVDISTSTRQSFNSIPKEVNSINQVSLVKLFTAPMSSRKEDIVLNFYQKTNGPIPRSYLPALLLFPSFPFNYDSSDELVVYGVIESALQWYLDNGGRMARLEFACPPYLSSLLSSLGKLSSPSLDFGSIVPSSSSSTTSTTTSTSTIPSRMSMIPEEYSVWTLDVKTMISHCHKRLQLKQGDAHVLYDILGRLYHDIGMPNESIEYYTKALQLVPTSTATFRNLGSAYQAIGNTQMAFASYQQVIQIDPNDTMVYLKLAYFYEDFATKDWIEAADNAEACYRYYLEHVDREDTAVLTRLGNLLIREHKSEDAIAVYSQALVIDPSLYNVWFNKAHAEMKIGDYSSAQKSLENTIALNPNIIAAKHMLKALSDKDSISVTKTDEAYVKDLYAQYAQIYDEHGKKLLYSAPRVIRQEMAKIYKAKLNVSEEGNSNAGNSNTAIITDNDTNGIASSEENVEIILSPPLKKATMTAMGTCSDHPMEAPSNAACVDGDIHTHGHNHDHDPNDCNAHQPQSFMSGQLTILDLGCGTGLSGAWLKDYAKRLIGVDISPQMINIAKKKMLYDELIVSSISEYLQELSKSKSDGFDLIVAAEVMSYIGDLSDTFKQISPFIRPGGHFVFTTETTLTENILSERGFKLLKNGRFGYSKAYLDKLVHNIMGADNFLIKISRSFSPRLDAGEPTPGYLYIIERKS